MIMRAECTELPGRRSRGRDLVWAQLDWPLLLIAGLLLFIGLVFVASSSLNLADRQYQQPFFFLMRQGIFTCVAVGLGLLMWRVPMSVWERLGVPLLLVAFVMLVVVLIPGVGREVNGSVRWLSLGPVNLQVSELVKLFFIIFMAGYLVRRDEEVKQSVRGFAKPMLLLAIVGGLLLQQPDLGATAVLLVTVAGMLFLAGARLWQFTVLLGTSGLMFTCLVLAAPYRMARVTSFMDPWSHAYDSGFQLTQSLIAFGRGDWLGVGLGGSVQKLSYLPEAHTDFIFAVIAEEGGLFATLTVILLFTLLVWRAFAIARMAQMAGLRFTANLSYGLGLVLGIQAFVNIGVNMGLLPTKGLTLPLMSYGGSSLLVSCAAIALLLRAAFEARQALGSDALERQRWVRA